jgi:hypothetical protein
VLMRPSCLIALITIACSSPSPSSESDRERLVLQALVYGLDSLAAREEGTVRPCVGLDTGRTTVDPSPGIIAELRKRDSRVLTRTECQSIFQNIDVVHDTILIAVDFDSIATSPPRIGLRTWRSGLWGGGHLCSVRQSKDGWQLGECQMVWIS